MPLNLILILKKIIFLVLDSTTHIRYLIKLNGNVYRIIIIGKLLGQLFDKFIRIFYSLEVRSDSINVEDLVVGHSVGVVLGGNGIECNGKLHISSGVVFGASKIGSQNSNFDSEKLKPMFTINGNLTVGANTVILGPAEFRGDVFIGAGGLLLPGSYDEGTYVGVPAKRIK